MNIAHIAYSDAEGGAARAAFRVHQALQRSGTRSKMHVVKRLQDDPHVQGLDQPGIRLAHDLRNIVAQKAARFLGHDNPTLRTLAWWGAGLVRRAEAQGCDLINLHWIGEEAVSLREIARTTKPLVWRVADMWPLCGAEHYPLDEGRDCPPRWQSGYAGDPQPGYRWLDIDRHTWLRKRRLLAHKRIHFVATSDHVARCLRQSALHAQSPVHTIANPLDTDVFRPIPREAARAALGLPSHQRIVLFGALGGTSDPRKGFDLLEQALHSLAVQTEPGEPPTLCAVFGQSQGQAGTLGLPVHWLGVLRDDLTLALAYSAADVMVVPSRQETFGQTVSEALACGTPVAAFDCGGPATLVQHGSTGWLARPFDAQHLCVGLQWLLRHPQPGQLREQARAQALQRFSYPVIAARYREVYEQALAAHAEGAHALALAR